MRNKTGRSCTGKARPLVKHVAVIVMSAAASSAGAAELDVRDMSPEDLAKLQVTSVSRRPELMSQAAASVYVITAEDIRRSPATTLTEVLRLAPTLFVPFDNAIPGYVSARGQTSGVYTGPNKLLVLIDGRSVYSPFFSGVFWDAQVPVLPDIERIEVISGPAGVLWGVNAVNGVINIITKNAAQTQGVLASYGSGDRAQDGVLRYGSTLGENGHYRVYGQVNARDASIRQIDGARVDDSWRKTSTGGRVDWQRGAHAFSGQFNAMTGDQGQPTLTIVPLSNPPAPFPRTELGAFNALGRWSFAGGDGSNTALQVYVDHTSRHMQPTLNDNGNVLDLEVQRNEAAKGAHKLAWGGNFRYYRSSITNSPDVGFFPEQVSQRWFSVFAQDEISLSSSLRLTAGARIEWGPYGTADALPTVRLAKQMSETQTLWGGLSRAARGPTRIDTDFRMPATGPVFIANPQLRSERVDVAELGYRYQGQAASASVTIYKNFYDRLASVTDPNAGVFPLNTGNLVYGQATGIEFWGDYRIHPAWRVSGGFTAATEWYAVNPGATSVPIDILSATSPANTLQLRSSWNLPWRTELDLVYRHVSSLGFYQIPGYDAVDLRLGWKINKQLQLDLIGQNLFGTQHAEYGAATDRALMTQRIYTRLTWRQ